MAEPTSAFAGLLEDIRPIAERGIANQPPARHVCRLCADTGWAYLVTVTATGGYRTAAVYCPGDKRDGSCPMPVAKTGNAAVAEAVETLQATENKQSPGYEVLRRRARDLARCSALHLGDDALVVGPRGAIALKAWYLRARRDYRAQGGEGPLDLHAIVKALRKAGTPLPKEGVLEPIVTRQLEVDAEREAREQKAREQEQDAEDPQTEDEPDEEEQPTQILPVELEIGF